MPEENNMILKKELYSQATRPSGVKSPRQHARINHHEVALGMNDWIHGSVIQVAFIGG